jgi:hypothetical protein
MVEYLDALDYSGSGTTWPARIGNPVTLYNAPTYTSTGPVYFNFNPSSLQYGDAPTLGNLGTWTVECWYNLQQSLTSYSDPALVTTIYQDDSGTLTNEVNFALAQGSSGGYTETLGVGYFNGNWVNTSTFTPSIGSWAQMVGTFDGTTVSCYLNSSLIGQVAGDGASSANGGLLRIARRWDSPLSSVYLMPAQISVIRIYNTALTSSQVTQNFNTERGRFGI